MTIRVDLAFARPLAAATARRWKATDVNALRVKVQAQQGDDFVDTGVQQEVSQKAAFVPPSVTLKNLAAGRRYRVVVEAWGNAGGTAAEALLNARQPTAVTFDFTATQMLATHASGTAVIRLDDVAFSGTATVAVTNVPAATTGAVVELWRQGGSAPLTTFRHEGKLREVTLGGLEAGPTYFAKVSVTNGRSTTIAKGETGQWRFDPAAEQLAGTTMPPLALKPTELTGEVTTLAGSTSGNADGTGSAAKFRGLAGVAVGPDGTVFVSDNGNYTIRKVTLDGVVTTFAGSDSGNIDGTGTAAKFGEPRGLAVAADGTCYVADLKNNSIRKITPAGVVSTLAGGTQGFKDGQGAEAAFFTPVGVALDGAGNVFVSDYNNHRIRKVSPTGMVTTVAGDGQQASLDGTGTAASFFGPIALTFDQAGTLYVCDLGGTCIRKVSPGGVVTTLAGGTRGFKDGTGKDAQFTECRGVAVDAAGTCYVADEDNFAIRKITAAGEVSTLAGGTPGFNDGTGTAAKFYVMNGLAFGLDGDLFVADGGGRKLRRVR